MSCKKIHKQRMNNIDRIQKCNKALSKWYHWFAGCNIYNRKREFVFIVGPSGSGKSTLLKLMLHEETPTEGEVYVNEFSIHDMPEEVPYLRRGLGVVFRISGFYPTKPSMKMLLCNADSSPA